jgi:flagellum-specific ATP synthase
VTREPSTTRAAGERPRQDQPTPVPPLDLAPYFDALHRVDPVKYNGCVEQVIGLVIESNGPAAQIGEVCHVRYSRTADPLPAEVVGFRQGKTLLMPLGEMTGIRPGSEVVASGKTLTVGVGDALLGRVLNGLGQPMDGGPGLVLEEKYPVFASPPDSLRRRRIREHLQLGIRAIDGLLTIGRGQRIGVFSGSGVGKSTVMGMVARNTSADVNVIGLTGERGREVRDFIERDLGAEGLQRSVVVVATSDRPALVRVKAALVATAVAEYFRDRGADVLLMMDSVTRVALAQREIGLAIGEPPATRGYTPSVFALLPRLMERAGTSEKGSITGLYTVLVEADDMNEPVADTSRSILDGHIVLSRALASQNHYPAVDVLNSISRVMVDVTPKQHQDAAKRLRSILAVYKEAEDLINIGAYARGSNPQIDEAIDRIADIRAYLQQEATEKADYDQSVTALISGFGHA